MYPVPTEAATQGRTDLYIGTWLKGSGRRREDVVLATKVCQRGVLVTSTSTLNDLHQVGVAQCAMPGVPVCVTWLVAGMRSLPRSPATLSAPRGCATRSAPPV